MSDLPAPRDFNLDGIDPVRDWGAPIPVQRFDEDGVLCLTWGTRREVIYQDGTKRHIRIKPCHCIEPAWQLLSLYDTPLYPKIEFLERTKSNMPDFGIQNRPRFAAAMMVAQEQGMVHGDAKYGKEAYLNPTTRQIDLLSAIGGSAARLAMAIATGQTYLIRRYAGNVANFAAMVLHKHLYDSQLPFVGQKVKHVPSQVTAAEEGQPAPELKVFDAEITQVWSDNCVNVRFTDEDGNVREHTSVMYFKTQAESNNPCFFCFDAEERMTIPA